MLEFQLGIPCIVDSNVWGTPYIVKINPFDVCFFP